MKGLLLAAILNGASANGLDSGSLGIGMDVLPEAFTYATSRVNYAPELRLSRCDATQCQWHLGDGVDMIAHLSGAVLDVGRVEARLETPASSPAALRFRKACLAIVSLFEPDQPRRYVIAAAIAAHSSDVAMLGSGRVRFYGLSHSCTAAASPAEQDERP